MRTFLMLLALAGASTATQLPAESYAVGWLDRCDARLAEISVAAAAENAIDKESAEAAQLSMRFDQQVLQCTTVSISICAHDVDPEMCLSEVATAFQAKIDAIVARWPSDDSVLPDIPTKRRYAKSIASGQNFSPLTAVECPTFLMSFFEGTKGGCDTYALGIHYQLASYAGLFLDSYAVPR